MAARFARSSRMRVLILIFSIGALGMVSSCGGPRENPGIRDLNGVFVADDGVLVVPDRGWRREGARGGSLRRTATLLVFVQNDRPEGLIVSLTPNGPTGRLHFAATWDGRPLWRAPRGGAGETLLLEIGESDLSPGLHRLTLDRVKDLDEVDDRKIVRSVFDEISFHRVEGGELRGQRVFINRMLADFLEFGVASRTHSKLSGCLFLGPQSHSTELAEAMDGEATFVLENESRSVARFSLTIGDADRHEFELRSRERREIAVPVSAGADRVTLRVEGEEDGLFLWGAPYLRRSSLRTGPPVVLITLDTTRRDVVAPFSGRRDLTPVIGDFATIASVYANAYATSPWTLPSHASIFTGLYPSNHGAGVVENELPATWTTLAEAVAAVGYRTAGFAGGYMTSSGFGMAQGFSMFLDPRKAQEPADVITDAAIDFIADNWDSPLFLFLNYFDPHGPYSAPAAFQDRFGVEPLGRRLRETPGWAEYVRDQPGSWNPIRFGEVPATTEALVYLRARYEAEVAFMDSEIGRLFESLREHGLYDEALIILVADHGEFLGERGFFSHSYRLDRELTAVPMLIKWPHQTTGEIVEELVSQVDLYPAIAAVAGARVPDSDGFFFGQGRTDLLESRPPLYLEEHESRFHQLDERFKVADHLYGMQWLATREVFAKGLMECSMRDGSEWVDGPCTLEWEQRIRELPPGMRASLELETGYTAGDVDRDTADKLRALGYLE